MNFIKTLSFIVLFTLATAGVVSAAGDATTCTPVYGGGQTCASTGLVIDKKVKHPSQDIFVDNLTVNDPKYSPNQAIAYRIAVTNTSSRDFSSVTVTDTLPNYLTAIGGAGSFNASNNTVTYTINGLKAGATNTIDITAKTASTSALPTNQGNTCVTNKARAQAEDITSEDSASYCIQVQNGVPTTKGGLPVYPEPVVQNTPKTGPEMLQLAGLMMGAAAGLFVRRMK